MKEKKRLEIVLKCDLVGSTEAVSEIISKIENPELEIRVIHMGVGPVSKSDLVMALTGSRLVVGFNVGLMPKMERWVKEYGVEVRTYDVIYKLAEDLERLAGSFITPAAADEIITGRARVIELFKSSHGDVILGCEVLDGVLAVGKDFRLIAAMGPIYTGRIESLHIEAKAVKEAKVGQQVGLKIEGFKGAKKGDLLECYEAAPPVKSKAWRPQGRVINLAS